MDCVLLATFLQKMDSRDPDRTQTRASMPLSRARTFCNPIRHIILIYLLTQLQKRRNVEYEYVGRLSKLYSTKIWILVRSTSAYTDASWSN
jgi:hypothetical protein